MRDAAPPRAYHRFVTDDTDEPQDPEDLEPEGLGGDHDVPAELVEAFGAAEWERAVAGGDGSPTP